MVHVVAGIIFLLMLVAWSVSRSPRSRGVADQVIRSGDLQRTMIVALDTFAASRHDASRPTGTAVGAPWICVPSLNC